MRVYFKRKVTESARYIERYPHLIKSIVRPGIEEEVSIDKDGILDWRVYKEEFNF